MKALSLLLSLLLVLSLPGGCATGTRPERPGPDPAASALPGGHALVVLFVPSQAALFPRGYSLSIGEALEITLKGGTYTLLRLPPGPIRISSRVAPDLRDATVLWDPVLVLVIQDWSKKELVFQAEPGESLFVKVGYNHWRGGPELSLLPGDQGREEIQELKFVEFAENPSGERNNSRNMR